MINKKNNSYYDSERLDVIDYIPNSISSLLDIGCGNGKFGAKLKLENKSLLVWGVEPNKHSAIIANNFLDYVIEGEFNKNDIIHIKNDFDCITFNDILEHTYNPLEILIDCKDLLNNKGVVVASIPNILFFDVFFWKVLIKEDWEYTIDGVLDSTHVRFFTLKSIKRMFMLSNLEIVNISGINPTKSKYYKVFNFLMFNKLKNWKFQQYIIVAKKKLEN